MKTRNVLFFLVCLMIGLNTKAQDDYYRITDLSQIQNGSSIVFAARHDSLSTTSYYAMSNDAAGKPQGVLFSTATHEDLQILPAEIADNEQDYCWTVGISDDAYTFMNSEGDMIAYGSSGTDFVKNGVNSTWTISNAISGEETSVPAHEAFVITNVVATNRSFAFRKYNSENIYEKFAPYSNSQTNMEGDIYFFYIDIFVKDSEVTPVVSLPTFSPAGGDYTTTQNVVIACATDGATVYYTLDGSNPSEDSDVYSEPIIVSETTTIKAFAKKEGMTNSGIATATYNIIEAVTVSFYENGSLMETMTVEAGEEIGELPEAAAPDGFSFDGWTAEEISGSVNEAPDMLTANSVIDDDVEFYAVFSVSNNDCEEIDLSSLNQTDAVVIAISKDDRYYAMSQIKGSSGQPTAYEIIVSNGNIVNAVPDDIKWNIKYESGEMMIYPNADEESWLYCTSGSNNNSVRIGSNEDNNVFELKTVEIDDVTYPDYLYNKTTERFVGAYYDDDIAIDWRAYKLTASGAFPTNIKNQTYHFFKSDGISYYCTDVNIPQTQNVTTNTTMENVCIMNKIMVEEGATLTLNGAVACADAGNLVVKDGGQLIHNMSGVKATIEKEIEGYGSTNGAWFTIASPLVNADTDLTEVENLLSNNYDLYRYDEPTSVWQNVKDQSNTFTSLEPGRGYLYANENDVTLSFAGELNYADMTYYLSKTEDTSLSGFHLIGNPFSHNIYKGDGSAIDDENLVLGYYTLSNSGAWGARLSDDDPITPGQSILVKTKREGEMGIKKTNAPPSRKMDVEKVLEISVENGDYEDKAFVVLGEGEGLEKVNHQNQDVPMIYVPVNDVNFAVAMLDADVKEIPVLFEAKTMGEYIISVNIIDHDFDNIYLFDNQTGEVIDMLADDYEFIATTNDNPRRFVLKLYDVNSVDEMEDDDIGVYINNGELIITNIASNAVVDIYNVLGVKVYGQKVESDTIHSVSLDNIETGIFIVRVIDDKGARTRKLIIK